MEDNIRMLRKRFKCINCGMKFSKLVISSQHDVQCESCGQTSNEISEEEYIKKSRDEINQNYSIIFEKKSNRENNTFAGRFEQNTSDTDENNNNKNKNNRILYKTKQYKSENAVNRKEGNRRTDHNNNGSSRISSNTSNIPRQNNTNNRHSHPNDNNHYNPHGDSNRERNNRIESPPTRQFNQFNNQSTSCRTENNTNNMFSNFFSNVYDSFGTAFNTFDHNFNNDGEFNRRHGYNRSENNNNNYNSNRNVFNNFGNQGGFFDNFFSNQGVNFPFGDSPFMGRVFRHNFDEDIFDPTFEFFGSSFNNFFRDNYSSNFRSNFTNGGGIGEIFELLRNQTQNDINRKTTSEKSLQKLKRFKMNEKYCKKSSEGKTEYPNCCICLSDVVRNEETVLLPCGHMFHWPCVLEWLKQNNTCPVCRFEL